MNTDLIQLFDPESSTFTYVLIDKGTREAIVIDSVDTQFDRDMALISRLSLTVRYVVETHAHADHVTGAGKLRATLGALAAAPAGCGITPANVQLQHGDVLRFGASQSVSAIHTPGHTAGSMCFVWNDHVFTGDTLLINGCGRTDFQSGSAHALYESVTQRLFTLPDQTRVWPGHDYKGHCVSTVGWERRHNPRLAGKSLPEFVALMSELQLPKPKRIDEAVPANQRLGLMHAV